MLLWLLLQTSWNQFVLLSALSWELQSNVSSPVLYCNFLNAPGIKPSVVALEIKSLDSCWFHLFFTESKNDFSL